MGSVLVTRAPADAGPLVEQLRARGHSTRCVALLERVPHPDALRDAVQACPSPDVLLLTSRYTVGLLAPHVGQLHPARVAAVGPGTAAEARAVGLAVDEVLSSGTGAELVAQLGPLRGRTVLYPHARAATSGTTTALDEQEAEVVHVVAYTTAAPAGLGRALGDPASVDVTLLTAASSARRLAKHWPGVPVVAIGPSTAEAAIHAGLRLLAIASEPTMAALVDAVDRALAQGSVDASADSAGRGST